MKDFSIKIPTIDTFIDDQSVYKELPYGSKGTIAGNGCGCIACFNALKYLRYDIEFREIYKYFNNDSKLLFSGDMGTNPISIYRYLKRYEDLKIKVDIANIRKKKFDAYIIINLFKGRNKKGSNAHYIFGYFANGKFHTHNLNNIYKDIADYLKKNKTISWLYAIYGINKFEIC